jgi:ribosomal protein L15E
MTDRHPKRPRDPNQLAKAVIDIATGEQPERDPDEGKDPAAVKRGRLGGIKGGRVRAERMTPAERKASALKAVRSRWPRT